MEIKISTKQVLKVLEVLSWIIFIGLCIDAGGLAVNTIITLFINPQAVEHFWNGGDYLSQVYYFDQGHFLAVTIIVNIVAILKAIMFYMILKLFTKGRWDIARPFSRELSDFMIRFSYMALGIGLFSQFGFKYTKWLTEKGLAVANMEVLKIGGADVWLFMTVVLFVIGQMAKRGMELQAENDLTI